MKLALVTGGFRRLGGAIAARLAADGWTLALHGHSDTEPEAGLELGDWRGFTAELADPDAVAALVPRVADAFGTVPSLLVNSASRFEWDDAASATPATLAEHHAVNAAAPVILALALGKAGDRGSVVNILDQRVRNPNGDQLSYILSKGALWAATRTLASALAPAIRVNAVAPGQTIATPDQTATQVERVRAAMPLETLPQPADIADAVIWLSGAHAITGQTIFVDGGANLRGFERDFSFF